MYVLQISDVQVKGDKGTLLSVRSWHAGGACAAGLTETAPHPSTAQIFDLDTSSKIVTCIAVLACHAAIPVVVFLCSTCQSQVTLLL